LVKDESLGIVAGQRFRATGSSTIWEVVAVTRYVAEPLPHVRLSRVGAPRDLKTVSARVLRDKRYYQPLT
jgi:hypothetical protein